MSRSDFWIRHSFPEGRLPCRDEGPYPDLPRFTWLLSVHAIPSTPGSRSTLFHTPSGKNRDLRSLIPPAVAWDSCPSIERTSLRHVKRGSTLPVHPPERMEFITTLLIGSLSLRPVRLRRHPRVPLSEGFGAGGHPPAPLPSLPGRQALARAGLAPASRPDYRGTRRVDRWRPAELGFHRPLIEPDVSFSLIRLSPSQTDVTGPCAP